MYLFSIALDVKLCVVFAESAVWKLTEEVQEQQRLAEALGGLHQLQPVFLQVPPGDDHFTLSSVQRTHHSPPSPPTFTSPSPLCCVYSPLITSLCRMSHLCAMTQGYRISFTNLTFSTKTIIGWSIFHKQV